MRGLLRNREGGVVVDLPLSLIIVIVPLVIVLWQATIVMFVFADTFRSTSKIAENARRGLYATTINKDIVADFCATRFFASSKCTAEVTLDADSYVGLGALLDDVVDANFPGNEPGQPAFNPAAPYVRLTFTMQMDWLTWAPLDLTRSLRSWRTTELVAVDLQ